MSSARRCRKRPKRNQICDNGLNLTGYCGCPASRAAAAIGAVGRLAKKPVPGAIGQAVQRTAAQIAAERLKAELRQAKSNLGRMRQRLKDDEKELGQLEANLNTTKRDLDKFNC
ncbi:MAG: hypothetical protein ACR2O8_02765 [Rhizobiaceae bacterium]